MALVDPPVQRVSVAGSMREINPLEWDRCVGSDAALAGHAHLDMLEQSGTVTPETGFKARHVLVHDQTGRLVAAAPAWLKTHSNGELGIDLGLAMAHGRMSGPYYPKLQVEVPFVPNAGPRLLVNPAAGNREALRAQLIESLKDVARKEGASSVQITYALPEDVDAACGAGFLRRESNGFMWRDKGYGDHAGFLAAMNRSGRHRACRDMKRAEALGVRYDVVKAADASPAFINRFHSLYRETYARHGLQPWLTEDYFRRFCTHFAGEAEFLVAREHGNWTAAFACLAVGGVYYAQHWVQEGERRDVMFGLYQFCLKRIFDLKVAVADFSPTGAHKTLRGITMEPNLHALWFADPQFGEIASRALDHRSALARQERNAEMARSPLRHHGDE
ncbi:MAG TPA: peptidoglycan bridge formation glycyltransferase FemA/FemB family protein [Aestuariivirga sp.]|nr:peptidoglycan bridge formation glycyltransferase FemA/FemB family protein [Aestuariivirga sp.]